MMIKAKKTKQKTTKITKHHKPTTNPQKPKNTNQKTTKTKNKPQINQTINPKNKNYNQQILYIIKVSLFEDRFTFTPVEKNVQLNGKKFIFIITDLGSTNNLINSDITILLGN